MNVIKRDGKEVSFDKQKIIDSLAKTNLRSHELDDKKLDDIATQVEKIVLKKKEDKIDINDVQDIIEKVLVTNKFVKTSKEYILYRDNRTRIRENKTKLLKDVAKKLNASNIVNQNANVDEKSFGGRKGEANNELLKWFALNNCMSKKSRENHENNEIYIHDLDSYVVGMHNCLSIPFDHLLKDGFTTRQTDIRPANSIGTAFQLVAVIFQLQSLQQFGGVSATHLDWTMVPYMRKSFYKHFIDGLSYIENINDVSLSEFKALKDASVELSIDDSKYLMYEKARKYALDMTTKELNQAVEAMYHNLNTLQSRSGNQLPFTSINYGTCTLHEGQLVIKALLEGSLKGVGRVHRTPIFPCGIFQYMKGVNDKEGTPNYELFKLALKSTSKRLYPNYANVDWSGNAGYDKNDPKTYFSTMGALAGHEHLYIKIDEKTYDVSIKALFDYLNGDTLNILNARPCKIFTNKEILNNEPHPEIQQKSNIDVGPGVYIITHTPDDVSYIESSSNVNRRLTEHRSHIRLSGGLDAGPQFGDSDINNYKFEILEYTEDYENREKFYIESLPNINVRGISSRYYKVTHGTNILKDRPTLKQDITKRQILIDVSDKSIFVLDRENKWIKLKHIFKNDKKNSPLMMHVYYLEDGKTYCLSCTEDHPLWDGKEFKQTDKFKIGENIYRMDGKPLEIVNIGYHWDYSDSYDIGTYSGSFIGSDIIMHNCRTSNGYDINAEEDTNPQTKDGRGNICPVTIILPTLAMESNCDVESFMTLLDKKIYEAKDMLIERFDWICAQSPESASFMYDNLTMIGYHKEEGIKSALKHGTLAIGQIGMAETLQLLLGCNQTKENGMRLAKRIEQLFKDRCNEFKQKYKLNFGVYYTPAENLCYTSMKKFKSKYGEIPNVSDRDYFTNSIHVPVWEHLNAFEKIDIESQLTGYSSAGCITYVELESAIQGNLEALEVIVKYAMEKDIPYFAINVPNDTCLDCGYTDEFNDHCPQCGSHNIQQLRRVTGYLTGDYKSAFNWGKQKETEDRVKHL